MTASSATSDARPETLACHVDRFVTLRLDPGGRFRVRDAFNKPSSDGTLAASNEKPEPPRSELL
jgi:hypothetical protein